MERNKKGAAPPGAKAKQPDGPARRLSEYQADTGEPMNRLAVGFNRHAGYALIKARRPTIAIKAGALGPTSR